MSMLDICLKEKRHQTKEHKDNAPFCPRCESLMVLRTAKRGHYIGNQFWGCRRYPDCKGIRKYHSETRPADIIKGWKKKRNEFIHELIVNRSRKAVEESKINLKNNPGKPIISRPEPLIRPVKYITNEHGDIVKVVI